MGEHKRKSVAMNRNLKEAKPLIDFEEEKLLYQLVTDFEDPSVAGFITQNRKNGKLSLKIRFKYADGEYNAKTVTEKVAGTTSAEKFFEEALELFNNAIDVEETTPRAQVQVIRPPDDKGDIYATANWLLENDLVAPSLCQVVTEGEGSVN